ncbi:ABC transporter substrate-binding protein [Bacillus sp. JJ1533]|uniref:ABC transporter substrate-binding protein n=1 Tax=Bacillus sp. JJ1533 TaxID=3122959 RepID=UPI0030005B11
MKKFSILLVSLLLMFSLIACSSNSSGNDDQKMELTFWSLFGGGDGEYMKAIINSFNNEHPEIYVKSVDIEFSEFYPKLMTAVSSGNGPDMAITHTSKLPELVTEGVVTELDDIAKSTNFDWDMLNKNILDATVIDGNHYAIPIDTHPYVMYYNKDILNDLGLLDSEGKPKFESTPEGFLEFGEKLKSDLPDNIHAISMPYKLLYPYRLWWSLYHQLGGNDLIAEDLVTPSIDMEKAVKAADYMKEFYDKGIFSRNMEPNDAAKAFQSGNAALLFDGVWTVGAFSETKGLNFGVMGVPQIYNEQLTWGDSHTIIMPLQKKEDAKKEEAIMTFAKYVVENGKDWAKAGHIPSKKDIADDPDFKELPHRTEYTDVADMVVFPKASKYNWILQNEVIRQLDTVWNGDAPAEDAINEALEVIDRTIE